MSWILFSLCGVAAYDHDEIISTALQEAMHSVHSSPSIPGNINMLDESDLCVNQPWRFRTPLPENCKSSDDDKNGFGCCGSTQLETMQGAFDHAVNFIGRTQEDRKENVKELKMIADNFLADSSECGQVLGLLASARLRVLTFMEDTVSLGVDLLYRTFDVLSCSVCFSTTSRELPASVVQLARDWRRVSRDMVQFKRTVSNIDDRFLTNACVPSIIRDLQVHIYTKMARKRRNTKTEMKVSWGV